MIWPRPVTLFKEFAAASTEEKQRIAAACLKPTFLPADVAMVATFDLFNINRSPLKTLIHRVPRTMPTATDLADQRFAQATQLGGKWGSSNTTSASANSA